MIKPLAALLAFVLITADASAAPVITSITPNTSPVSGGIHVAIKGDGFTFCPVCSPPVPPSVFFGSTPADSVRLIDMQTLDVITPAHLPGAVDVFVDQFDGSGGTTAHAFTFVGDPSDAFERILLPIYSPPIHGAFGSEFHTIVRAAKKNETQRIFIYGIDIRCLPINPIPGSADSPFEIPTGDAGIQLVTDCSTWPARFLYVAKTMANALTLNDRVLDVSRSALSNGTEIPIVRSSRFTSSRIVLLGVPIDLRFRNTLRIYGATTMTVVVNAGRQHQVQLQAGATIFEPAVRELHRFSIAGRGSGRRVDDDGDDRSTTESGRITSDS